MAIQLFEHNQKAYEAAMSMLEEEGMAAIIHPTGTGKSFIAFKMAEDHPDARICWFSPSEYIYRTQLENVQRTLAEGEIISFDNIRYMSYAKLMVNEDCMEELAPDYIVLDEFHRCGAAEWGKSVQKLLAMYPEAKRLGLSATNIRYLDNQRDMAQEIFEGNVASEMTLGEAIARGILATPRYVLSLYSYEKELKKLVRQVAALENKGLVYENNKLLEQLRRTLQNADGPDLIFDKYMQNRHGKYIVFCSDREHMEEIRELVPEWFGRVDDAPNVYMAYYNNPDTNKAFKQFKEDQSEHLKLLFCIDMLNEGVHVSDIDGVILLRPTVSPIIYLQQIGRSLAAGTEVEPIIFDMVNNFDSLYCIDYLTQEIENAFSMIPCTREKGALFEERFRILDDIKDCRVLFQQLQSNLSSAWNTYYLAAKEFYDTYGHLQIPKGYATPTGLTVGSWIQTQRKVYAGKTPGDLTEEKIARLNSIGMIWDVRRNNWQNAYEELCDYHREYGNLDVVARYVSPSGFALGSWISNLRGKVKKLGIDQVLTKEQQKQLSELGMIWDKKGEKIDTYLQAADDYKRRYGHLNVPLKYVSEGGISLGKWIHYLKNDKSGETKIRDTLTEDQRRRLDELGMEWENPYTVMWNQKFSMAKAYFDEHGDLEIPVSYCVEDVKLGKWISAIRTKRKKPGSSGFRLDEARIRALDSIGMRWE